ncbi:MAG: alkaline phosphatase [Rhizobiales bacterium]|nr:alkaline phosphatase [Hyphomicrobiales bacterium]
MTRLKSSLLACAAFIAITQPAAAEALPQQNDSYYIAAAKQLEAALARKPIEGKAKNVILFVGDGMSVPTVTAARILEGQKRGVDGESNNLTIDLFPFVALAKTYSHDGQVSDSAPTATAMTTGIKTKNDIIGLNQNAMYKDCEGSKDKHVTTAFELAEAAGLATGVVSTARITHATPAAAYAHVANRDWEDDAQMKDQKGKGCLDIADQLVNWGAGDGFEVALGGGRQHFLPKETADPEDEGKTGTRTDGRNLTEEWTKKSNNNIFVWNGADFAKIDLTSGPKILGLFDRSHMEFEADRAKDKAGEPSLAEMTALAIDRLSQNDKGYILMVEGGRIDHAHHNGNAARALEDTLAFDQAVKTALEKTKREDTLIIVTADHSHAMTINGYPKRGNPILGVAVDVDGEVMKGGDGIPYTTLAYANGPGAVFKPLAEGQTSPEPAGIRPDPSATDTTDINYLQQAIVPLASETHAGDDVAVYAWGPQAHLMQGTVEQNYIYHVIAHAMGLNAGM